MNMMMFMGHLGGDPESRFTPSGKKVTNFSVAVNTRRGKEDQTTWYRVAVWGDQYDAMMQYLKKGSAIIVIGELSVRTYTDKAGATQVSLEVTAHNIQFPRLGKGGTEGGAQANPQQKKESSPYESDYEGSSFGQAEMQPLSFGGHSTGDDLPF